MPERSEGPRGGIYTKRHGFHKDDKEQVGPGKKGSIAKVRCSQIFYTGNPAHMVIRRDIAWLMRCRDS